MFGGANLPLRDWDLCKSTNQDSKRPDDASGMIGARLGVQVLRPLAIEGEVSYLPVSSTLGGTNKVMSYSVNAICHILPGDWTPYVGVGMFHNTSGDLGKDADPRAQRSAEEASQTRRPIPQART